MIDRNLLRTTPEIVRVSLQKRGEDPSLVDKFIKADSQWRSSMQQYDQLKAEKNQLSKTKPSPADLKKIKEIDSKMAEIHRSMVMPAQEEAKSILESLPNLVAEDVPVGIGESANTVIKEGKGKKNTSAKSHEELMIANRWLDLDTAAEYSGSRFRYLKGHGAFLHFDLMYKAFRWAKSQGFIPVIPPVMTREQTLFKAGFFPTFKEDIFKVENEDHYLTGTSEQTILALVGDRVFEEKDLPLRFVGFSTCFRKEAGSYGKDVKGMFRQHQFDKVEMVSITTPENSIKEHEYLVSMEEQLMEKLHLPYELMLIGSGDLGPTAVKKIDINAWFPSQDRYRETHSASNCTDYQARRFAIKVKRPNGKEEIAHTLNATLATERLLLALVENNQTADGLINLPKELSI